MRAEALFRKHPDILEQELKPPIVITGLQRTGTTFLHRLLAADPAAYSLLSWEALNPAPLARKHEQKKRIALARTSERVLRYMAPEFFAIHGKAVDGLERTGLQTGLPFLADSRKVKSIRGDSLEVGLSRDNQENLER